MTIKFGTFQTYKYVYEPENKDPSLTRASEYVSVEELFARFKAYEGLVEVFKPIAELSPEEKDVLYNGTDLDDLADEDLVVQKAFLDEVQESLKAKKVEKDEPTQAKPEPEPVPDKAAETK